MRAADTRAGMLALSVAMIAAVVTRLALRVNVVTATS